MSSWPPEPVPIALFAIRRAIGKLAVEAGPAG